MLCIHFHLMPMMIVMIAMIILLWMLTIYCHRGFIGWLRLHWAEREMATIGKGKAVSSNKGYLLMIHMKKTLFLKRPGRPLSENVLRLMTTLYNWCSEVDQSGALVDDS